MKSKSYKINEAKNSELFDSLAEEWWNENGSFKALHSFNFVRLKYIRKQIRRKSMKNLKILDIGCGGGLLCEPLKRLEANVTGIDTNRKAIDIAREHSLKNKLKIDYRNIDLDDLKSEKFDLITCMEVLEHTSDVNKIVAKSKTLLKENGVFIGSTINKTLMSYILALFFAERILKIVPKGTHDWNKLIKPNYLKKIFIVNGFYNFEFCGVSYNPFRNLWRLCESSDINYMFCASTI